MKMFIIIFTVFISGSLFAELETNSNFLEPENRWEFGLGLNMLIDSDRGFVVNINPSLQYFIFKNFSVGGFFQFYSDDILRFYSVGPSATFFILRAQAYSIVLNQRLRFRQYIKPDNVVAASTVSLATLAIDYSIGSNLSARLGIGYKRSLDDSPLTGDSDEVDEWIFPTFGIAYYL